MKKIQHKVPYTEFTGKGFDIKDFAEAYGGKPFPEKFELRLDEHRTIRFSRNFLTAELENLSDSEIAGIATSYVQRNPPYTVRHKSEFHTLHIEGDSATFTPVLTESLLEDGLTAGLVDKLDKRIPVLKSVLRRLGIDYDLNVESMGASQGCQAVKLCIKPKTFKNLEEQLGYITNTLLDNLKEPPSALMYNDLSSFKSLRIQNQAAILDIRNNKNNLRWILSLAGKIDKEPTISYTDEIETLRDRTSFGQRLQDWSEEYTALVIGVYIGAITGGVVGLAVDGLNTLVGVGAGAGVGAGIGAAMPYIAEGIHRLAELLPDWSRKWKEKFVELARGKSYLKEPFGQCFYLSTPRCAKKL